MARELSRLAASFGATLPASVERDVATLTAAIEEVDRILDDTSDVASRSRFGRRVLAALDGGDPLVSGVDLSALRATLARASATPDDTTRRFRALVERELDVTERRRTTRDVGTFIHAVEEEGRLTVAMLLVLVEAHTPPSFATFLRRVAEASTLFDALVDATADYRRGEMSIRPSVALHLVILRAGLARFGDAYRAHPSSIGFARWGATMMLAVLRSRGSQNGEAERARVRSASVVC